MLIERITCKDGNASITTNGSVPSLFCPLASGEEAHGHEVQQCILPFSCLDWNANQGHGCWNFLGLSG